MFRTENPDKPGHTYWGITGHNPLRIDYIFASRGILKKNIKVKIRLGSPLQTDHDAISVKTTVTKEKRSFRTKQLNDNILKSKKFRTEVEEALKNRLI